MNTKPQPKQSKPVLATHYSFDEAHMTTKQDNLPPYATALHQAGYSTVDIPDEAEPVHDSNALLHIKFLSDSAKEPTRSTEGSAGLDLQCATDVTIPPQSIAMVETDLAIELPKEHYGQIQPRSGMAVKQGIFAIPGVIDSDYRGNIKVILLNTTKDPITISKHTRVGQMIVHRLPKTTTTTLSTLTETTHGSQGFGSTEKQATPQKLTTKRGAPATPKVESAIPSEDAVQPNPHRTRMTNMSSSPPVLQKRDGIDNQPKNITTQMEKQVQFIIEPKETTELTTIQGEGLSGTVEQRPGRLTPEDADSPRPVSPDADGPRPVSPELLEHMPTPIVASLQEMLLPYTVHFSTDIYDNILVRHITNKGSHPTRGLILKTCPKRNLPIIQECAKSTPAAKLPRWRSTMRGAYLLALNDTPIKSEEDVIQFFCQQPQSHATVAIKMGTIQKIAMHPDDGVPIMYFDQLNMIARHLRQIKYEADTVPDINTSQSVQPPTTSDRVTATIKMLRAIFIDGIKTHTAAMHTAQASHTPYPETTTRLA